MRFEVSDRPITGNRAGLMSRASSVVPDGSRSRIALAWPWTRWRARSMSENQAKSRLISVEPRLVVERIWCSPGTRRRLCSSGTVTARSISSVSRSPLSAIRVMRGKVTSGRIAAGRRTPSQIPAAVSISTANPTARCWANRASNALLTAARARSFRPRAPAGPRPRPAGRPPGRPRSLHARRPGARRGRRRSTRDGWWNPPPRFVSVR